MKTTFKEEDNYFVMYFEGRLDTAASAQTEEDMKPVMANTCRRSSLMPRM